MKKIVPTKAILLYKNNRAGNGSLVIGQATIHQHVGFFKNGLTVAGKILLAGILMLSISFEGFSQTLPPGQAAKFGIDGDTKSDQAAQGSFTAAGSHDWFKTPTGSGRGLFDTAGYARYAPLISTGKNVSFVKPMQYSRYSLQDGILMLDAAFTRDHFGIANTPELSDKTVFVSTVQVSNKNWQNPASWTTIPAGSTVPNKSDIIDAYVNMRRNGNTISGNNPSHLVLTVAATTLATEGDHYIDFDLFQEKVNYDNATGKFIGGAPSATGGRSPWLFDQSGKITKFGDMTISFTYNSSQVQDIQIFIWVDYDTYKKTHTERFDFVNNSWNGQQPRDGYGFAQIIPNGNYSMNAWGTVNTTPTEGPSWGTSSKDIGNQLGNYYSTSYAAGQFAEAGINLTLFGIDPATTSIGMDLCNPPFSRFMVKTRSSSSFSAALQDFIGPFEFLDAPTASAKINQPANLTCSNTSATLTPAEYLKGAYYSWSTKTGSIIGSNSDSSAIKVDKAGTYYLKAAVVNGCKTSNDSIIVSEDKFKPVATITASTSILSPGNLVTLYGGNATLSNYLTPFGGSKGLTYTWSGPSGFTSIQQNPQITDVGSYELTVTEVRNGCTDRASVSISESSLLSAKFTSFNVSVDQQTKARTINWKVANPQELDRFVVEKSSDGASFAPIGHVFADNSTETYKLREVATEKLSYYRVRAIDKAGQQSYTSIRLIRLEDEMGVLKISVYPNPVRDELTIVFPIAWQAKEVNLEVVSTSGNVVLRKQFIAEGQTKTINIGTLPKGLYILKARNGQEILHQQVIKN